jgi:hypothetical protein
MARCNSAALNELFSTARTKIRAPPSPSSSTQNSRRHPVRLFADVGQFRIYLQVGHVPMRPDFYRSQGAF